MENMCQEVFAVFAKYFSVYAALSNGHEQTHKRGISCRRKRAGWDNQYLMQVLCVKETIK